VVNTYDHIDIMRHILGVIGLN